MNSVSSPFCVVCAANDEACLARNLMSSEMIRTGRVPLHVERGAPSAAHACNGGLDATEAPIVIFAHQDVYFPPGWEKRLAAAIEEIEKTDPDWALLAPFGMARGRARRHLGPVWSTSLGRIVGAVPDGPHPAQSFDELVIVMRRDAGLRFDEALPGFHLYGLDIVQTALEAGRGAHVAPLPLVHNDDFHDILRRDFAEAFHYARRKWRHRLPLQSVILRLSRHGLELPHLHWRLRLSMARRRAMAGDSALPGRHYARLCGWE